MNTSDKIERLKRELDAAKEGTPEYDSLYKSLEYYNSSSASENQLKSAMDAANSNNIKTPYFKNLENDFGITDIEGQEYILGRVFKYNDRLDTIRIIKDTDVYEVVDKSDDNIVNAFPWNWSICMGERLSVMSSNSFMKYQRTPWTQSAQDIHQGWKAARTLYWAPKHAWQQTKHDHIF